MKMRITGVRRWAPAAAIAAYLFTPPPTWAEEQQAFKLEPVVVTATKTEAKADTIPFTTHSVDRETLDAQPSFFMNNVGELIRDLPGVHVGQYYPWGPPWIHLRGTGYFIGRTVYLVDGLPTWSFMSTTLNPNDIARVDVVLGPSSALYGANASGGAVNFITRSGTKGMGAKGQIAYGSNNTIRPHVSVGDAVDNWRYYLSYSGDYSDGYKMKPVEDALQLWSLGKKQYLKRPPWRTIDMNHHTQAARRTGLTNTGQNFPSQSTTPRDTSTAGRPISFWTTMALRP